MRFDLAPHPNTPSRGVRGISVSASREGDQVVLAYAIAGEMPQMPKPTVAERADDLWQTTCFELFVGEAGASGYVEFNFSPSGRWAAYRFADYRAGREDRPIAVPPRVERTPDGVRVAIDLPDGNRIGLTAVIEETDGTKSYWALAHPQDRPDFHDRDGFCAERLV